MNPPARLSPAMAPLKPAAYLAQLLAAHQAEGAFDPDPEDHVAIDDQC